jgi:hypothetical protein
MIELTTGVAFLLASMYGLGAPAVAGAAEATNDSTSQKDTENTPAVAYMDRKEVEKFLREKYKHTPILVEIARCESTFTHIDKSGKVIRGMVDNKDVGVMQINERYHLETATKLGYDLHTIEGNVAYAQYLYEREGARPWKASQPCWSKAS